MKQRTNWQVRLYAAGLIALGIPVMAPSVFAEAAPQSAVTATATVTGTVFDENGEPVIGATVTDANNPGNGTMTDINGKYILKLPKGAKIKVSYVGYETQTLNVPANGQLNVNLKLNNELLDEVVVVGYGTQKKGSVTGSVVAVGNKELNQTKTANPLNALAGKLPGLRAVQRGGQPGADSPNIEIRNYGSPMYIVDGFERDKIEGIDPEDIESISVLKDAAAAVYGFKGGNGVILITTKKGSNTPSKPKITYDGNVAWQSMTNLPKLYNSYQYANVANEIAAISGNPLPWGEEDLARFKAGEGTDWFDEVYRDAAPMTKHNINVSGASEKVNYYFSLGYFDQESIYKNNPFNFQRYNVRSNIQAKVWDGVTVSLNLSGRLDERQDPHQDKNIYRVVEMALPYRSIYANDNPEYYQASGDFNNPVQQLDVDQVGYNRRRRYTFEGSLGIRWDLPWVKGLSLNGNFRYDYYMEHNKQLHPAYSTYNYNEEADTYERVGGPQQNWLKQNIGYWFKPSGQLSINYTNSFGVHDVSALVLYEFNRYKNQWVDGVRYLDTVAIPELDKGVKDNQSTGGSSDETGSAGLVGRVNYAFDSRYLIEFSFRYDGNYRFQKEKRWGFFPGVSVGWRLSQEKFFNEAVPFVENLKIRGSIAKFGNVDGISAFMWQDGYNYPSGNYLMGPGNYVQGTQDRGDTNKILTWADVITKNIGLEFSMWNGMLSGEFDFYWRNVNGKPATQSATLPTTFGQPMPQENLNKESMKGWELQLGHRNRVNKVTYTITGNVSMSRWYKNYQYRQESANSYRNWRENPTDRVQGVTWGYTALGQFKSYEDILNSPIQDGNGNKSLKPGDIKYADLNGDGIIDGWDEKPISHSNDPFIYYGLNLGAEWNNFDLTLFFQGAAGHSIYINANDLTDPLFQQGLGNGFTSILDHWHQVDPSDPSSEWISGFYPSYRQGRYSDNYKTSTYWKADQDYLRLKTIELGYTLPSNLLKKCFLENVRFYANATNLLTFKKDSKGVAKYCDPENSNNNFQYYPQTKNITLGVRVTF